MVLFPKAKVNLGLNVMNKRNDGFHAIQSVMLPIDLKDILEVLPMKGAEPGTLSFNTSGIDLPGNDGPNLCQKAHTLFLRNKDLPGLQAHLHKNIPIGAGLGGGSSDAASMLLILNELCADPYSGSELHSIASELGSDVPFFLMNRPCLAKGRGEELELLKDIPALKNKTLAIVNPGIHISTAEAYAGTTLSGQEVDFARIVNGPIEAWKNGLFNSMESHAFKSHPVIEDIKRSLYSAGAEFALMSGSGSTVYGIFDGKAPTLNWPEDWISSTSRLSAD